MHFNNDKIQNPPFSCIARNTSRVIGVPLQRFGGIFMKEIKLTQGKVALVDDEDFEWLNQLKWQAQKGKDTYYAKTRIKKDGKIHNISMHRYILGLENGRHNPVDHINHNGCDNQRFNIRVCTNSNNCANRKKIKNCSSKYKGVCLRKGKKFSKTKQEWVYEKHRWIAEIKTNKISTYIGSFNTQEEAALAYNEAAKKIFGEFAYLNVITP